MERSQLFVCFDLHGPAWKPADRRSDFIFENIYLVWLITEPSWAYPANRRLRRSKRPLLARYHWHKLRVWLILTITSFTNVLRFRQMDWKQFVKMDAPYVPVSQPINIHTAYWVLCIRFAANVNIFFCFLLWRCKNVYENAMEKLYFLLRDIPQEVNICLCSHATSLLSWQQHNWKFRVI